MDKIHEIKSQLEDSFELKLKEMEMRLEEKFEKRISRLTQFMETISLSNSPGNSRRVFELDDNFSIVAKKELEQMRQDFEKVLDGQNKIAEEKMNELRKRREELQV